MPAADRAAESCDAGEDRVEHWIDERIDLAHIYAEIWKDESSAVRTSLPAHARDWYRVLVQVAACRRLCRIELAVALLDPSGTEMALYCDADMVRAIVGARQVKFLSFCPAGLERGA